MSTTTYLGITKLVEGGRHPDVEVNAALDLIDGFLGNPARARIYHNANQSIANSTVTALAFNSERNDTNLIHDTSTNNSRLTCKTAGTYLIIFMAAFEANATGVRTFQIRLNGSTVIGDSRAMAITVASTASAQNVVSVYPLAVNDYVEAVVFQTSGGALNVLSAGNQSPEFMMIRMSA
jgi:hypothetical protein